MGSEQWEPSAITAFSPKNKPFYRLFADGSGTEPRKIPDTLSWLRATGFAQNMPAKTNGHRDNQTASKAASMKNRLLRRARNQLTPTGWASVLLILLALAAICIDRIH